MQIKVKKEDADGVVRVEALGEVREILINEDFMHPDNESISVCFKGKTSSGILDFSPEEIDYIFSIVKKRAHLIKGAKFLTGKSAI
jgi:hypothetical protein